MSGATVYQCANDGGAYVAEVTCGSPGSFASECTEAGPGIAGCSCEDDWDCPGFQECEAGSCQGSKEAPTCRLPPDSFSNMLPEVEFEWGGASAASVLAVDGTGSPSPFPASGQVVLTPLVANLTDDNGDGTIDERDFPEIIFNTFCDGGGTTANGLLRAVHGGGPDKGKDYFANCAGTHWIEGDDPDGVSCTCDEADLDSTANPAVGDLNGDGIPEIVAIKEVSNNGSHWSKREGYVRIYNNLGELQTESILYDLGDQSPTPTLANMDKKGNAEIVIGRHIFFINDDFSFGDHFEGTDSHGFSVMGPISCAADLDPDTDGLEIAAGSTVYGLPIAPNGEATQAECAGGDSSDFCQGVLTLLHDGDEGFCAVADVWGADQDNPPGPNNPLDGKPEIVVVGKGNTKIYADDNGVAGFQLRQLGGDIAMKGADGGPPNVDDFDGDGYPEIGSAAEDGYSMLDLQPPTAACPAWPALGDDNSDAARTPPASSCLSDSDCGDTSQFACNENQIHSGGTGGTCVCLHNGWSRATEDNSSRVTGSSVFDFNGDGAAEVIYNDECFFRVYDGASGDEHLKIDSESRTRSEYPIVADVDNDGNAEIIFAVSNESGFCNAGPTLGGTYNNGFEVWGDTADRWVSARRIWNQHAYHVTNVTEAGQIPVDEPNSWEPLGLRLYNTFRSQPRSFGSAPDLVVDGLQVIAPGSCGASTDLLIGAEVRNAGDLRVSGVPVRFEGTWEAAGITEELLDGDGNPIEVLIEQSLEPEGAVVLQVIFKAENNPQGDFPDSVRVIVDPASGDDGVARECNEDNNSDTAPVDASPPLPDLIVQLDNPNNQCPPPLRGKVTNGTSVAAPNVKVRIYAGDPATGAAPIGDIDIGSVEANASVDFNETLSQFPSRAPVLLYGEVDPDNEIEECNEANNIDGPTTATHCFQVN